MKSASTALVNSIRRDYTVYVQPKLTAEWNLNRYYSTNVYNTPSEDTDGFDIEQFPIESIVEPIRPVKGGAKAFTGEARVSPEYTDAVPTNRFYLADPDSMYKYWRSPYETGGIPFNFTFVGGDTTARPSVEYVVSANDNTNISVTANKIVITFETTRAVPDDFSIWTKVAGTWGQVSANPAIVNGQVILYWNGSGWTTTKTLGFNTNIQGIRVRALSMSKKAYLDVVEISARREVDLSSDLISAEDSQNMGEKDFITPMGDISSNEGSISLWNSNRAFSTENTLSPYAGLLDKNVEFRLDYEYTLGSGKESIRQFTLYSENWSEQEDGTVNVDLVDFSRVLQEVKPRPVMYQNVSVQEAIWRLCDLVGFSSYNISVASEAAHGMIPVFWTDGEQTLWEIFSELAKAHQVAVYLDAYGVLQIKTREAAFDNSRASVWTLRENTSGVELSDILDLTKDSEYETNKVTIEVQPTAFKQQKKGMDVFEVVWEPEGTATLRATQLIRGIDNTSNNIWIDQQQARTWNYSGIVNIQGEFIKYEGKQYMYFDGSTKKYKSIKSANEQNKLRAKADAGYKNQCQLTGALTIAERGYWNSEQKNHSIDIAGWNTSDNGWKHDRDDSKVTVDPPKARTAGDYTYFYRGDGIDEGFRWLGTRMKIKQAGSHKIGGIFFNADNGLGSGYYVEVVPSSQLDGEGRDNRNEIVLYSRKTDGSKKVYGGETVKFNDPSKTHDDSTNTKKVDQGAEAGVYMNQWFELDITFEELGNGDHRIIVAYNGRDCINTIIPNGSGWQHTRVSRGGFFVRGQTQAEFDYYYGITRPDVPKGEADHYFDRVEGSWYAQQWQRDWMYEVKKERRRKKKKWTKVKVKYSQRFFDEFGPMVHEVREYDVKFDKVDGRPVVQSKLFATNREDFAVIDFTGGPFGATFTLANTARRNVVINGEDALAVPEAETPPRNLFFVWGRPLIQKDSEKVVRKNDKMIARRGIIDLTFSSKWLQSKDSAEALADWIVGQWSASTPSLSVEIFGNPLIELTDVVSVQYEEMTAATHQYFVVGIETGWDNGVTTKLTLRRKVV